MITIPNIEACWWNKLFPFPTSKHVAKSTTTPTAGVPAALGTAPVVSAASAARELTAETSSVLDFSRRIVS